MENKITKVIKDIDVIKNTIENTKTHYRGMYLMCFLLAFFYTLRFVFTLAAIIYQNLITIQYFAAYLLPFILMVGFLYIYKREQKYSNKYYLSLLSIWATISIAIPIIVAVIDIFGTLYFKQNYNMINMGINFFMSSFSNVILFSIFLIVFSYVINKKKYIILSIAILFLYMFLTTLFADKGFPVSFIPNQKNALFSFSSAYSAIITCFGYTLIGFYLKYIDKKEKNK